MDINLERSGETYRIYTIRSMPHNYPSDALFWDSNSYGDVPLYTAGDSSINGIDFSFRTYNDGVLDQESAAVNYGFYMSSLDYDWQEFVPEAE